ncbi:site-2 protease family protein [Pelagibacterium montanilacus]|uniref:site-2 protease family protein n=1 Tax=Pelagibacterium montanilacus TaxID=2185280 RepID=UPI000F8ED462|nr:site-2 protease family protein [Pelagibacterium montanilacus]
MVALGALTGDDMAAPASAQEAYSDRFLSARPRLAGQVRLGSVHQRDETVYRAHDAVSGRTVEMSAFAAAVLHKCDGTRLAADIARSMRAYGPDQTDAALARLVVSVLRTAEGQGLLVPIAPEGQGSAPMAEPGFFARTLRNPLFTRISLFSPDRALDRLAPLARAVFSGPAALVWGAIVGLGAVLAASNFGALVAYGQDHALDQLNLLWLVLLFPLIKIIHEMGHALACKRWGGEVRDFGVMMLVFVPIPYVDCSDSAFFVRRRQRIAVAGAGMMAEFVIATVALVVWIVSTEDFVRLLAFNAMVLTTLTTVVFNANPLLRFDAYYILCEVIGIDNLGTRSQKTIRQLARRVFLGEHPTETLARSGGEAALFVVYGVASFLYKCFIVFVVIVSVFPRFFIAGLIFSIWGAVAMVGLPIWRTASGIATEMGKKGPGMGKTLAVRLGVPILIVAGALALPIPYAIIAQASVAVPPQAIVRAGASGQVAALPAGRAAEVAAGDELIRLTDDILDAEILVAEAQLSAQTSRYQALLANNIAEAGLVRSEMAFLQRDLAQSMENRDRLVVTASSAGTFDADAEVRTGTYVQTGQQVGLLSGPDPRRTVLVSLSQEDADLVRARVEGVAVRAREADSMSVPASILRDYPLLVEAEEGSGQLDATGRFVLELAVEDGSALGYGRPVEVRIDLGSAPAAQQMWRAVGIWFEKLMMSRHIHQTGGA